MPRATQTNPNWHGWDREENSRQRIYDRRWLTGCTFGSSCHHVRLLYTPCGSDEEFSAVTLLTLRPTADVHAMAAACTLFCKIKNTVYGLHPCSGPFEPYTPINFAILPCPFLRTPLDWAERCEEQSGSREMMQMEPKLPSGITVSWYLLIL